MTVIHKNTPLKGLHTFGISVFAKEYTSIQSEAELKKLLPLSTPYLILGGGSNILFTQDFEGLVVHNQIKGIQIVEENVNSIKLKIGAGEIWHDLVLYCIAKGYGGIENLALIPGTVGAAPIQNIGAYGVEIKDVLQTVKAINLQTGEEIILNKEECQFGYRDSIFKQKLKNKYCITHIILSLNKKPIFNLAYGAIDKMLKEKKLKPSIKSIADIIIKIRSEKLPNPKKIGNAGSFFKNPIIDTNQFLSLKNKYPNMPSYPVSSKSVKIPAGWLIDQLGWKGYRKNDIGVHENQALVLVNHQNAKGEDIWELAQKIKKSVLDNFGITIITEVNIL